MTTDNSAKIAELQVTIQALRTAGLTTASKEAELAALQGAPAAPAPAQAAAPVAQAPEAAGITVTWEVDRESFESGGDMSSPAVPGIHQGRFVSVQNMTKNDQQKMFVFQTEDPRLSRQYRSGLMVTLKGGDFALSGRILGPMRIPYTLNGNRLSFTMVPGTPCWMEYEEIQYNGKTEVRLQKVHHIEDLKPTV